MAEMYKSGLEERLQSATPSARFEFQDVLFSTAHMDVVVQHGLRPTGGEQIAYVVVQSTGPAHVYQDASSTRRKWTQDTIVLRSDTANVRVRLLLFLPATDEQTNVVGPGTTGATSLASGQFTFPATQAPSTDANTLDDYEEGTWTPSLQFGGAASGMTYGATRTGHYIKVGQLVHISFRLVLTARGTSTGNATVTGLPFTSANDGIGVAGDLQAGSMTGLTGFGTGLYVAANGTSALLTQGSATGDVPLTHAVFTNTSDIVGTVTYRTNQ